MKTTSTLAIAAALILAPATGAMSQATTAPGAQPAAPAQPMPNDMGAGGGEAGTSGSATDLMVPNQSNQSVQMPSTRPGDAELRTAQSGTVRFIQVQDARTVRSSNLMGADVMSAANEDIGEVNDLLFDLQGRGVAVVVGVGGFLGIGEKNVAVPFERLSIARDGENADDIVISLDTTREELNAAPEFEALDDGITASTTTEGVAPMPGSDTGLDANRDTMNPPATGTQPLAPAVQ